jgi:hypothetical protein
MKVWNERKIITQKDDSIEIKFNQSQDMVMIRFSDNATNITAMCLELTFEEAEVFANQIIGFIEDNKVDEDKVVEFPFGF